MGTFIHGVMLPISGQPKKAFAQSGDENVSEASIPRSPGDTPAPIGSGPAGEAPTSDVLSRPVLPDDGRGGRGRRWRVRYADLDGRERSRSFDKKADAVRFETQVSAAVLLGTYMDPDVGKVTLRKYAGEWLAMQAHDTVTGDSTEVRLRVHIYPALGGKTLAALAARPSLIQAWASGPKLAPSSARGVLSLLSSIMAAAVRDGLISKNPCAGTKLAKPVKKAAKPAPKKAAKAPAKPVKKAVKKVVKKAAKKK